MKQEESFTLACPRCNAIHNEDDRTIRLTEFVAVVYPSVVVREGKFYADPTLQEVVWEETKDLKFWCTNCGHEWLPPIIYDAIEWEAAPE